MSDVHDIDTHADEFSIVVNHYGDARGTREQFDRSDPSTIDPLINGNIASYHLATDTLAPGLSAVRASLQECWQGESASNAYGILDTLQTNASSIGTNTKACHDSLATFQGQWQDCKQQASGLYEGIAGTGVHEDNSGAHRIYAQFTNAMQTSMWAMPSNLQYSTPLTDNGGSGPGPGPGGDHGYGPGVGGYGPGPVTGTPGVGAGRHIGTVRKVEAHVPAGGMGTPVYGGGNGGIGPGTGSGPGTGPGPGGFGPGGTHLAGWPPGSGGMGPGGVLPGGGTGVAPALPPTTGVGGVGGVGGAGGFGAMGGLETGRLAATGLADDTEAESGLESEVGLESEAGLEPGVGLGSQAELESEGGLRTGTGLTDDEDELMDGDAASGRPGLVDDELTASDDPTEAEGLAGRGMGSATGNDEDERTRSTWLNEDDGIWDGDSGAPPGVIA